MLAQLEALEQKYSWNDHSISGFEWRWIDTGGSGPVVVLLPGSVGDAAMFVSTLLSLGEKIRLLAVTYPAISDPKQLADGLSSLMDEVGVAEATIVGSSFAAYWAQFFALHYSNKVRHLIIGNGFTDGTDLADNPLFDRKYVESVSPEQLHSLWVQRVREAPVSPLQQLQLLMLTERQTPENLYARFLGVVRSEPCPALPLPAEAVTVLDCADDPLIPPAARERLRNQYPDAHHVSFETGAHYPHLLNPTQYEALIDEKK